MTLIRPYVARVLELTPPDTAMVEVKREDSKRFSRVLVSCGTPEGDTWTIAGAEQLARLINDTGEIPRYHRIGER